MINEKNIFKLEKAIKEFRHIPLAEIKKMVEINKRLDELTRQDEESRKPYMPVPEYKIVNELFNARCLMLDISEPRKQCRIAIEKEIFGNLENATRDTISQAIKYLDNLSIWQYKFKSGEQETELSKRHSISRPYKDSTYYVTDSGLSLRLKTTRIWNGFSKIRQPIFEKIFFRENELVQKHVNLMMCHILAGLLKNHLPIDFLNL